MKCLVALLPVLAALQVGASPALAWTWPVDGPVLRPFVLGDDPYAAGQHRGVDLGAPAASPVRAPAAGAVTFAGTVPGGGLTLTVLTADGYAVTLLHLGSLRVERGASVGEGDVVGSIGPTGTPEHAEPYVHLGIRVAADAHGYVDPLTLLPRPATPEPPAPEPPAPEPQEQPGTREEQTPAPATAAEPREGSGSTPAPARHRVRTSADGARDRGVGWPASSGSSAPDRFGARARAARAQRSAGPITEVHFERAVSGEVGSGAVGGPSSASAKEPVPAARAWAPTGAGLAAALGLAVLVLLLQVSHACFRAATTRRRRSPSRFTRLLSRACGRVRRPPQPSQPGRGAGAPDAALAVGVGELRDAGAANRPPAVLLDIRRAPAKDAVLPRSAENDRVLLDEDLKRILLRQSEALANLDRNDDPSELVHVPHDSRCCHSSHRAQRHAHRQYSRPRRRAPLRAAR